MNPLNALFDWVLGAGLRASLLVLAVLATHWLLKNRLPSRWRYALWLPVLAALLVPALPLLPSWMNWPAAPAGISEKATSPASVSPALMVDPTQEVALPPFVERADISAMSPSTLEVTSSIKTAAAPAATPVNWRAWLMAGWFIGAGGVSLFVVVSFALTSAHPACGASSKGGIARAHRGDGACGRTAAGAAGFAILRRGKPGGVRAVASHPPAE